MSQSLPVLALPLITLNPATSNSLTPTLTHPIPLLHRPSSPDSPSLNLSLTHIQALTFCSMLQGESQVILCTSRRPTVNHSDSSSLRTVSRDFRTAEGVGSEALVYSAAWKCIGSPVTLWQNWGLWVCWYVSGALKIWLFLSMCFEDLKNSGRPSHLPHRSFLLHCISSNTTTFHDYIYTLDMKCGCLRWRPAFFWAS